MNFRITATPDPGESIDSAAVSSKALALACDAPVELTFNETSVIVHGEDSTEYVVKAYNYLRGQAARRQELR